MISAMFCGYSEKRTWDDESCLAWKPKDEPKTNGDHVRAMTDKELAQFITGDFCEVFCGSPSICHGNCEEKMLSWLKSPMEE